MIQGGGGVLVLGPSALWPILGGRVVHISDCNPTRPSLTSSPHSDAGTDRSDATVPKCRSEITEPARAWRSTFSTDAAGYLWVAAVP